MTEKIVREILRSRQNPRVQEARRLTRDLKLARAEAVFVADGTTIVIEALQAGLAVHSIFLDPADAAADAIRSEASLHRAQVTFAVPDVLQAISTLRTAQGAIGFFTRPRHDLPHLLAAPRASEFPLVAVFHELQDPTNVGALIRTASAAGLSGVVTTEGTCDPYHPRAVRASMGACLRLPLCADQPAPPLWEALRRGGYRMLALDPRGGVPVGELRMDRPTALILGREGTGLEDGAKAACEGSITIPMAPGVESLGVAAAGAIAFYMLGVNRPS